MTQHRPHPRISAARAHEAVGAKPHPGLHPLALTASWEATRRRWLSMLLAYNYNPLVCHYQRAGDLPAADARTRVRA